MNILIAGGTSFVGRAIAWSAWRAGHRVSVINRGQTPHDLPDGIERLIGDRQRDLSALTARTFDATIDTLAYRPSDVEKLAEALGARGGHHLQISSVSAYADPPAPGLIEDDAVLRTLGDIDPEGPINNESYGPLKAACELRASELFGESLSIVRPTFVIGAHDATLRFPYWVERARRGGAIAVPGPGTNAMQWIDARDLAQFVVGLVERSVLGAFHVAGPSPSSQYLTMVQLVVDQLAPPDTTVHEVAPERIREAHLSEKFPLWTGPQSENILAVDNARALHHGLTLRPLSQSVDEVVAWWADRPSPDHWLSASDEAQVLTAQH